MNVTNVDLNQENIKNIKDRITIFHAVAHGCHRCQQY